MKKIIILFAFAAFVCNSTTAQKSKSKFDKNYRICFIGNKYQPCDANAPVNPAAQLTNRTTASLSMESSYIHMGHSTRKSNIRVTYDDPNAPYKGEESMVNDGVNKNIKRNINYLDNSVTLPPNDGGLSNR